MAEVVLKLAGQWRPPFPRRPMMLTVHAALSGKGANRAGGCPLATHSVTPRVMICTHNTLYMYCCTVRIPEALGDIFRPSGGWQGFPCNHGSIRPQTKYWRVDHGDRVTKEQSKLEARVRVNANCRPSHAPFSIYKSSPRFCWAQHC
jgi:hypothetical protein